MLKSFKTEIDPSDEQKIKINKTIGVLRFIYNLYLAKNIELYKQNQKFMTDYDFSKWLNNEYLLKHPEKSWIKEVSSKSVKNMMKNGYTAFKKFFEHKAGYPKFKKKHKSDIKMYFVKNNPKDCLVERHRIKIPTLGYVKIKEKGYIPTSKDGYIVKSGHISKKAGRYYVSVIIDVPDVKDKTITHTEGIGIDLGIKDFAICSNGDKFKNINKTHKMKQLEKSLKRSQRSLSRKYENKKKKGETTQYKNIAKQMLKVQKLHQRIDNIRTDHLNKTIAKIVKTKPSYIVIENLNVSGMMKNKHLSKAIASQKFHEFKTKLKFKCDSNDIELRIADKWYPSSKLCHRCGNIKKDLKLSERTYKCICGYTEDRDFNASLNLRDVKIYTVA